MDQIFYSFIHNMYGSNPGRAKNIFEIISKQLYLRIGLGRKLSQPNIITYFIAKVETFDRSTDPTFSIILKIYFKIY